MISDCLCRSRLVVWPTFIKLLGIGKGRSFLTGRGCYGKRSLEELVVPVAVKSCQQLDDFDVGAEFSGKLQKDSIVGVLNTFARRSNVRKLSAEHGLGGRFFQQAMASFRRYCQESPTLPVDLHLLLSDVLRNARHVDELFPMFLGHARKVFPHLECLEELEKISDLRMPQNWYPDARRLCRRFVFHAGPTNSGKTYHALKRFATASSAVYCAPLKLLASEVYHKCNADGVTCDLITGEERCFGNGQSASNHIACTVEMLDTKNHYDVAVIDEIQMMRDVQRGWAWTRALLAVCADEVHLCGEAAALELVKELLYPMGEEPELILYERKAPLELMSQPLFSIGNVQPGDCIVAFNKNDVFRIAKLVEDSGHQVAVIYGSLPPGTKVAQAQRFNNPDDPCNVLVATDAIGMGLNLSIKRVIFASLTKMNLNSNGDKEMETISTSQALQIAGRAGRYGMAHSSGLVTTIKSEELPLLRNIMARQPEPIERAGLFPTLEQIELFAYYLPQATLSNLLDIFLSLSAMDEDHFFMCNVDDLKFLADMIEHVPLPLRVRYVFCMAPISRKKAFVCGMFLRFARKYSQGQCLTVDWLCSTIGWPLAPPTTLAELMHLEDLFDVLDTYLWLSYRFVDMFPDVGQVRALQIDLDVMIRQSLANIRQLTKTASSNAKAASTGKVPTSRSDRKAREGKRPSTIESLIQQGLLTPKLVEQIRNEVRAEVEPNLAQKK